MKFDRFKYAEEHAHQLDRDGRRFVFTNDPDATYDEDGEIYKMSVYTVEEDDGCPTCHGTLRTYSGTEIHSLEQAIALQADGPCFDCPAGRLAEWDYMIDRMNWLDELAVLARCAEEHRPYNRDRLLELLRLVPDQVRPPWSGGS